MIKILASDGMEKGAIAELQAKGCQVDCQFYEPDALCEACPNLRAGGCVWQNKIMRYDEAAASLL